MWQCGMVKLSQPCVHFRNRKEKLVVHLLKIPLMCTSYLVEAEF